jgi:hypothetical protein
LKAQFHHPLHLSRNNSNLKSFFSPSIARRRRYRGKTALWTTSSCRKRVQRSAVSFIKRSPSMKMIAMKRMYHTALINNPMITVMVNFVAKITMKLVQAVRVLTDLTGDY